MSLGAVDPPDCSSCRLHVDAPRPNDVVQPRVGAGDPYGVAAVDWRDESYQVGIVGVSGD